jgi:hypothetical protein
LNINWSVSRNPESYGDNVCTLRHEGKKLASCDGGGYDMVGKVFGNWMTKEFAVELNALNPADAPVKPPSEPAWWLPTSEDLPDGNTAIQRWYGLTFHDPNYDPGKTTFKCEDGVTRTIDEAEKLGVSLGLERYQDQFKASSAVPTKTHTVPSIDGACGLDSVRAIMHAIGFDIRCLEGSRTKGVYVIKKHTLKARKTVKQPAKRP